MNPELSRKLTAEFIGTFMLVLVGAGAVVMSATTETGALIPALAHGFVLVAIIATYGHISGAHVNPAISLSLWIGGHIKSREMGLYMLVQILGALVASVVLRIIIPESVAAVETLGQTRPLPGVNELGIILVEAILTFCLASVVYQAAVYSKGGLNAPILIGLTLAASILLGGTLTGASLNPARTLGPAIVAAERQDLVQVLVYLAAIFGGGAVAGILHSDTFKPALELESGKRSSKKAK